MTTIKERTEIAQQNKRNIPAILEEIQTLATLSNEVALSCFYVVFNKEDNKPFVGISVRFAELIASCWGNIHTGAKITKNNGMSVLVQGFVHDFEKNAVFTVEVQRGLGGLSAEKSIQVTNAASSIAFRNAIFKAIPAAVTTNVAKNIKQYIVENLDGKTLVKELIAYFKLKGVQPSDIDKLIGMSITSIDSEKLFLLIGLRNAIEEGDTTIAEVFGKGEVSKPIRSSKFSFETQEVQEGEYKYQSEVKPPSKLVVDAVQSVVNDIPEVKSITVQMNKVKDTSKESLKNGLSHLAKKPKLTVEEEVIEDKPKEVKKKRGRGRPRKDEK